MKTIIFITRGSKRSGTETWRAGLAQHLRQHNFKVIELDGTSVGTLLKLGLVRRADVIHGYHASGLTLPLLTAGRLLKKRVVYTLHGNYLKEVESKRWVKKWLLVPIHDWLLIIADKITFPSEFLYQIIKNRRPTISRKSSVIPNGFSIEGSRRDEKTGDDKNLLMITNFNYHDKARGIVPVIKAFNRLSKEKPGLSLDILGDGRFIDTYRRTYEGEKIKFRGHQPTEGFIKNCAVFIHCTYLDNMPYVILEAIGQSKPVVTVPVGGIPEMVDASSVVPIKESKIYEKIKTFLGDEKMRMANIRANRRKITRFEWKNVLKDYRKVYET